MGGSRGSVRVTVVLALVGALLATMAAGCKSEAQLREEQKAELGRLLADARSIDKRTWEPAFEKLADLHGYEATAAASFLVGQLQGSYPDALNRAVVAQRVLPRTGEIGTDQLLRSLTWTRPDSHQPLISALESMGAAADAQVLSSLKSPETWRRRAGVLAIAGRQDARALSVLIDEVVERGWDDAWAAHSVASLGRPAADKVADALSGEPDGWYLANVLSSALYWQDNGSGNPSEPIDRAAIESTVKLALDDSGSLGFAKYLVGKTTFSTTAREWLAGRGYYIISIPTAPNITFGPSTSGRNVPDWAAP